MTRPVSNVLNPVQYLPEFCKISDKTQIKVGRVFSYAMEKREMITLISTSLLFGAYLIGVIPLHYLSISVLVFPILEKVCKPYVDNVRDGVNSTFFTSPRLEAIDKPAEGLSGAEYSAEFDKLCIAETRELSSNALEWIENNKIHVNFSCNGASPIVGAVRYLSDGVVEGLVDNGADLNVWARGRTPLHWAIQYIGLSSKKVEILLDAGADIEAKTRKYTCGIRVFTALNLAEEFTALNVQEGLTALDFLISKMSTRLSSPTYDPTEELKVLKLLLGRGATVSEENRASLESFSAVKNDSELQALLNQQT